MDLMGSLSRKCWPVIEKDFLKLIQDFYDGKLSLENINGSLITLIPKMLSPEGPEDFRPISLTNTCLKFLTKLLANSLQKVILQCIHKNQYGFLKSRAIQDCLAWVLSIYISAINQKGQSSFWSWILQKHLTLWSMISFYKFSSTKVYMQNGFPGLKRFYPQDHHRFFLMWCLVNSSNANVGSDRVILSPHCCLS